MQAIVTGKYFLEEKFAIFFSLRSFKDSKLTRKSILKYGILLIWSP